MFSLFDWLERALTENKKMDLLQMEMRPTDRGRGKEGREEGHKKN